MLDSIAVSGENAVLEMPPEGRVYVEDLDTTNGTHVNGEGIKKVPFDEGDILKIGNTQ